MGEGGEVFVGIDVAKTRNAVAIADGERGGEVRYVGEVEASAESMRRLVKRIVTKHGRAHFSTRARSLDQHRCSARTISYERVIDNGHQSAVSGPFRIRASVPRLVILRIEIISRVDKW